VQVGGAKVGFDVGYVMPQGLGYGFKFGFARGRKFSIPSNNVYTEYIYVTG